MSAAERARFLPPSRAEEREADIAEGDQFRAEAQEHLSAAFRCCEELGLALAMERIEEAQRFIDSEGTE